MAANGVPAILIDDVKKGPKESHAIREIQRWMQTSQRLLLLRGDVRVGKSLACAAALTNRSVYVESMFGFEPWIRYRYVDTDFYWLRANEIVALSDRFRRFARRRP